MPDRRVLPEDADPAERAVARESIRLAFVAALQHLPPRQRAVLILREVLRWKADEVAELLDTTVASVNSALQRARATLADARRHARAPPAGRRRRASCSSRYVDAFERYDIDALVQLLHEDATQSMPPFELWLRGLRRHRRLDARPGQRVPGVAAGADVGQRVPAVAQCRPTADGGGTSRGRCTCSRSTDGKVAHISSFLNLDNELFLKLGLPVDPEQR